MPDKAAAYASCKGAAAWASEKVGRVLTFKDCARRAVISKLANDPRLSSHVVADFMHLTERNLSKYYRPNKEKRSLAAAVLAEVCPNVNEMTPMAHCRQ